MYMNVHRDFFMTAKNWKQMCFSCKNCGILCQGILQSNKKEQTSWVDLQGIMMSEKSQSS